MTWAGRRVEEVANLLNVRVVTSQLVVRFHGKVLAPLGMDLR